MYICTITRANLCNSIPFLMERKAIDELKRWKNSPSRKPLIVRGARQVGKTWLIREFGRQEYARVAYVNFESSKMLQTLFVENFDIKRILTAVEIETGVSIREADTLIVFDEIQEAERGITSLKYFCENAPQYHLIAAGSLLGVALHEQTFFPVGKVEFLNLFPLSFGEFLLAAGQKPLHDLLQSKDWELLRVFKDKLIHFLRQYYYVGGMPEVVASFAEKNDFNEVRTIQKQILAAYEQDFSKHAPNEIVPRIRMLWNAIPAQLAKENKKFIYGAVKPGARAKEYELALTWLTDCGLVHKISRVSKPGIPLIAYQDQQAFKLFLVDTGLLAAMGEIDARTLLDGNRVFEEFKGSLTEQFVLQQLRPIAGMVVGYWSSDTAKAELAFLLQYGGEVIPVEVKAEENLHAKSLRSYCQKYQPQTAIRTSLADYRREEWLTNIPLYALSSYFR